jgi:hypothetical protein
MASTKDKFKRQEVHETDQTVRHCNKLLLEISDEMLPAHATHLGSIALHFYATTNTLDGTTAAAMATQRVNMRISSMPDVGTSFMQEIRDIIYESFGASKGRLAPQTQEEVRDTGGQIIKTRFDN